MFPISAMRQCISSCVRIREKQDEIYPSTIVTHKEPETKILFAEKYVHCEDPSSLKSDLRMKDETSRKETSKGQAIKSSRVRTSRSAPRAPSSIPVYHVYDPLPQLYSSNRPYNTFKMVSEAKGDVTESQSTEPCPQSPKVENRTATSTKRMSTAHLDEANYIEYPRLYNFPDADVKYINEASTNWEEDIANCRTSSALKLKRDAILKGFLEELDTNQTPATGGSVHSLPPSPQKRVRINKRYIVLEKLGSGSFGEIYKGYDLVRRCNVALKMEHMKRPNPHLLYEAKVYSQIRTCKGIPQVYWFGIQGEFIVLVMELMGPSLEHMFVDCGRRFGLSITLKIGIQMVSRVEEIHTNGGIIHRDIKPHNFLMGLNDKKTIYLIDFGLAKKYRNSAGNHIKMIEGKSLTGTARYVSIATHNGYEQSRRDDLESIAYVLLYFVRGRLPWEGIQGVDKKARYEAIRQCKMNTKVSQLCKSLPFEFQKFLQDCRGYGFEQEPEYDTLKKYLSTMLLNEHSKLGSPVPELCDADWEPEMKKKKSIRKSIRGMKR